MKQTTIFHRTLGLFLLLLLAAGLVLTPRPAQAQEGWSPPATEPFSREELAQMLAPIALYPDALLSQILMAATYPIEIIEADRWLGRSPDLRGDDLDRLLLEQDWDPSVKALCHFPEILSLMSERIGETTDLGNAFLAQEDEVMDMVQELRSKAYAEGTLGSTARQRVTVEGQTIVIVPADPQVIYVPYYDPLSIYGPWWYPGYPPYYWGPSRVAFGISYWPGISFGFTFGNWCSFDWPRHTLHIDVRHRPRFVPQERWQREPGLWRHDPGHRRGVAYRDQPTARKFGQDRPRTPEARPGPRGFPERIEPPPVRDRQERAPTAVNPKPRTIDRSQVDRSQVNRAGQERQRVESQTQRTKTQVKDQADREKRQRELTERNRQEQERVGRELKDRQDQDRSRLDRGRQERARVDNEKPQRERSVPEQTPWKRTESPPQGSRDNVFNRVDEGPQERTSSERGRLSRQDGGAGTRAHTPAGGEKRQNRDDRGRGRK